jgi:predicted anti-sigma-YlaC factor YlaD
VEEAMECTDYQRLISSLRDGELQSDPAADVFRHLSSCPECRKFYFELQALDGALDRIADDVPATPAARPVMAHVVPTEHMWWDRRIALRIPVLALLICAIAASLFLLIPGSPLSREPQAIYVTRLPTVVVEAPTTSPEPRQ